MRVFTMQVVLCSVAEAAEPEATVCTDTVVVVRVAVPVFRVPAV